MIRTTATMTGFAPVREAIQELLDEHLRRCNEGASGGDVCPLVELSHGTGTRRVTVAGGGISRLVVSFD